MNDHNAVFFYVSSASIALDFHYVMLRELNEIERSRHVTSRRRKWRNPSRQFTAPETRRYAQHWWEREYLLIFQDFRIHSSANHK